MGQNRRRSVSWAGAALAGLLLADAATAVPILTGHTIRSSFLFPDTSTLFGVEVDAVVGPGVEVLTFPSTFPVSDVDFQESSILITMTSGEQASAGAFNGWRFSDLNGTIDDLSAASIDPSSTVSGAILTAEPDAIFVNISGVGFATGQFVLITFDSVPEPGALGLGALGLLALAARATRPGAADR